MSLVVTDAALEDADAAATWYDSRRSGFGNRFLDEFERLLKRIDSNPLAYPRLEYPEDLDDRIRRALFRRFPYIAIYVVQEDLTTVIAVEHTSRQPGRWSVRLGEFE